MSKFPVQETGIFYAVCIGVNQYQPLAQVIDLRCAENDAQTLYDLLLEKGFAPENCCLLLGAQATQQAIDDALTDFIVSKPRAKDLVIFYFAGHGMFIPQPNSETDTSRTELFLVAQDFDCTKNVKDRGAWLKYPLRMDHIRSAFFEGREGTLSKKVLFLFDCCHSGDFYGEGYRGKDTLSNYVERAFGDISAEKPMIDSGRIVLSSCMPEQKSRENIELGHGLFTYHLIKALKGDASEAIELDGWITVNSLFGYLARMLPPDQRPVRGGVEHGAFRLFYYQGLEREIPPSISHGADQERKRDITKPQLKAMLVDHRGFMDDLLGNFVGRIQELEEIYQYIETKRQGSGYIIITGQAGQGKSSIMAKLVEHYGPDKSTYHFIPFEPVPNYQVTLLRDLIAQLLLKHNLADMDFASENRTILRDYFHKVLVQIATQNNQEVIFIDGLDQLMEDQSGESDLSFLPGNLPKGIVFVLSTRPDDSLSKLYKAHVLYPLPNLSSEDFVEILRKRKVKLTKLQMDRFYRVMQGNALYLDLVANELAKGSEVNSDEIIKHVNDNPDNIFSLAKQRLKRHAMEWEKVTRPILGVLLVAREPLAGWHIRHIIGIDDDKLRDGLARLGGLIVKDRRQRYSLFHPKLYDYLRQSESGSDKDYVFTSDEEEGYHKELAKWCESVPFTNIWQDVKPDRTEKAQQEQEQREYARRHYITHLYCAQEWERLFTVLDEGVSGYGRQKLNYDPGTSLYAQDLDIGRQAAARDDLLLEEGMRLLPNLWRYTLMRCTLASRANRHPRAAFGTLVLFQREKEALGLVELLTVPVHKVYALIEIAEQIGKQPGRERESVQILLRACEVMDTIKEARALRELGDALIKAQQWEYAEAVFCLIDESTEKAWALRHLGATLAEAQRWEYAEAVIRSIKESNQKAWALRQLGEALTQAQQWKYGEEIIRSIERDDIRARALRELSAALIQAQQWQQTEAVARSIDDRNERMVTLLELAEGLIQAQRWEQAQRVIDAVEWVDEKIRVLRKLGVALIQAEQWQLAEIVTRSIEDSKERAESLQELCLALKKAQQLEQASTVCAEAELVRSSQKMSEERDEGVKDLGDIPLSDQQSERVPTAELQPDKALRSQEDISLPVSQLVEEAQWYMQLEDQGRANEMWKRAEEAIRLMEDISQRASEWIKLGQALVRAEEWSRVEFVSQHAEEDIESLEESEEKERILEELIRLLARVPVEHSLKASFQGELLLQDQGEELKIQQSERIEYMLDLIKENLQEIEKLSKQSEEDAEKQKWEEAKAKWAEVRKLISSIKAGEERALLDLAIKLAQAGELSGAREVIEMIKDGAAKEAALIELAEALKRVGEQVQVDTARAEDEQVIKERERLLRQVRQSWLRASRREEAIELLSMAHDLILREPELGISFAEAFAWVDNLIDTNKSTDFREE